MENLWFRFDDDGDTHLGESSAGYSYGINFSNNTLGHDSENFISGLSVINIAKC